MSIYKMNCRDIKIFEDNQIIFSEDKMPLEQNCDVVEIIKKENDFLLKFWYDEGSKLIIYNPAFECVYIDSEDFRVDIYVSKKQSLNSTQNNFEMISISLKNKELIQKIKYVFALDKIIFFEDF